MLDLYDVCEMVSNDELALNRVSRCLEDIESITDTDVDQESLELDTERTKGDLFLSRLFFKKIKQKTQDSIIKNMRKNMSELVKGFENQIENYFKDEEILDYLRFSEYLENLIESCKECEGDDVILLSAIETIAHGPYLEDKNEDKNIPQKIGKLLHENNQEKCNCTYEQIIKNTEILQRIYGGANLEEAKVYLLGY